MFSIEHLETLRAAEFERILPFLEPGARILEIGAGTGQQARLLSQHGFDVVAVEIPNSNYAQNRVFPVIDYDGRTLPLPDASVDIAFSSNVLEHVPDLPRMHTEIARVLRPGGYCIHVLPTHAWRFWTIVSGYGEALATLVRNAPQLIPRSLNVREEARRLVGAWYRTARRMASLCLPWRHGERGTGISELWLFHPGWWRRNFRENGFAIAHDQPVGIFYTGNMMLGARLRIAQRAALARMLGSACHLFKLVPAKNGRH